MFAEPSEIFSNLDELCYVSNEHLQLNIQFVSVTNYVHCHLMGSLVNSQDNLVHHYPAQSSFSFC